MLEDIKKEVTHMQQQLRVMEASLDAVIETVLQ
jgi:hypothetical protein